MSFFIEIRHTIFKVTPFFSILLGLISNPMGIPSSNVYSVVHVLFTYMYPGKYSKIEIEIGTSNT